MNWYSQRFSGCQSNHIFSFILEVGLSLLCVKLQEFLPYSGSRSLAALCETTRVSPIFFPSQVTAHTAGKQVSFSYCLAFYDLLDNMELISQMFREATDNRKFTELTKGLEEYLF